MRSTSRFDSDVAWITYHVCSKIAADGNLIVILSPPTEVKLNSAVADFWGKKLEITKSGNTAKHRVNNNVKT